MLKKGKSFDNNISFDHTFIALFYIKEFLIFNFSAFTIFIKIRTLVLLCGFHLRVSFDTVKGCDEQLFSSLIVLI